MKAKDQSLPFIIKANKDGDVVEGLKLLVSKVEDAK
jgi:hypothetical protein